MSNQRIYIQLGRVGDICNILPLAYDDAQKGQRSAIMVAKEFAGLLSGCSYVDELVFDGAMWELERAVKEAEAISKDVAVVQLTGPYELIKQVVITRNGAEYKTTTESFLKDQWNLAGRLNDWRRQIPLVFDQRNQDREKELLRQHLPPNNKKLILFHAGGVSSPFPYRDLLLELLKLKFWRTHDVLDINTIKAERFYDLLGLFEHPRVSCLVATDSAPLHLAYACKSLPVVALVNDKPSLWHGSCWRPNHICHVRYQDFPARATEILERIQQVGKPSDFFYSKPISPKIIHVWSEYERNGEPMGWTHYDSDNWVRTPVEVGAVGHDSKHSRHAGLKDKMRYPFVKDVVRIACLRADPDDIICLTRAYTKLIQTITCGVTDYIIDNAPCYSHRQVLEDGLFSHHPAVDLFAFKKSWWQENQKDYPDMILGKDRRWHEVLKELMKLRGGKEVPLALVNAKSSVASPTAEVPPRISYNESLAAKFFKDHNITCSAPPVYKQIKLEPLNKKALFQYGYNPSIIRHDGKLLMAYRHHCHTGTAASSLAMAELDDKFNPVVNGDILVAGAKPEMSIDDPRLFVYAGDLYCSYVVSTWPQIPVSCVVRYGRLNKVAGKWNIAESWQVDYGKNDWSGMEKNWVFFEHNKRLLFIYHNHPKQVIMEVSGDKIVSECAQPTPHWKWGKIHAGTVPIPHPNGLLRFFHTRMDNEAAPNRHRYYIGACLMDAKPPFRIQSVSQHPILIGSEEDETSAMERASCTHRKPNVVFPGGAVENEGGGYLLSLGVNDCEAVIARVEDLKL